VELSASPIDLTPVKVLFASGSDAVAARTLEEFKTIFPDLPLVVVSEFPPSEGEWIRYHIRRRWSENLALVRSRLRGRSIRIAAMILEPRTPHRAMRLLALRLSPLRLWAYNETGQHFRMSPGNVLVMARYLLWRTRNFLRSGFHWNLTRGRTLWLYWRACRRSWFLIAPTELNPWPSHDYPAGISVVIPSRNGRDLLASCLPRLKDADEIIVIDNGSDDDTVDFLRATYPHGVVEQSTTPLSFADAVNRGIRRAGFSHVCLLNNDMLVEPGFLAALRRSFDVVPNLFSSSAQIFLPEGQRREETGKTILSIESAAKDHPVSCPEPLPGEDQTWVLYGSGGCTLYDAAKLHQLGGFDPAYEAAYVEDLDVGVRAWQRGWPSVYCGPAQVLHKHRSTTSRYFTEEQIHQLTERNFLRFVAGVLPTLWNNNLRRLRAANEFDLLRFAGSLQVCRPRTRDRFLRAVNGDVAIFPGKAPSGKPVVLVVSPYLPFPLSHGGAVRIYNLMSRAANQVDQILVSFVNDLAPIPLELTRICTEVVTVRRIGSHALPSTARPDTVEEFDSPAFHEALRQAVHKWRPQIAQLEFTQMAHYAPDCRPARTILVEHDVTYDLFAQMLAREEDWENRRQYERWLSFERRAWRTMDRVVTMSEKDRALIPGSVAIPNGVDLDRFRPAICAPEPRRLLFIGSFAHRPNVLAMEFFLQEVFPRLESALLHVIAGQRHEQFWDLRRPRVEVEGFVVDVRPAYERAAVVIAPLVASAGTNIKIMEAMAMGKAIVSTSAGIHGLELEVARFSKQNGFRTSSGADVVIADAPGDLANAIAYLLDNPEARIALERQARRTAELHYGWDAIGDQQWHFYADLLPKPTLPLESPADAANVLVAR
jgi:GT2 family glycosyltransferase